MSYAGLTYRIPFDQGGLLYDANIDAAPPTSMQLARNINYHEGGRESRGGTAKVNETAVSGTPQIMGITDFQRAGTSFQVFLGDDGKLYSNPTTSIKTGMSTTNYPSFAVFEDELYTVDGDTTPQVWDGSGAIADIGSPNGDWTGGNQPFQVAVHGRGVSRRLWMLFGQTLYYSSLGDGDVFTGGTSGTIPIDTLDSIGPVGMVEFGDRLIVFGRRQAYIVEDSNSTTSTWGYSQAQWTGGVAHWRLIVKTPNDLFLMADDGEIYTISTVQAYGDYKQASLTRPAKMDRWIRENVDLTKIEQFHGVYDAKLRCVRFFVVRSGSTTVDTCLKFFIDRPADQAWAVDDGIDEDASGFQASCSAAVRTAAGTYDVYTGDYAGFLWELEQTNKNDDDNAYYAGFRTPNMALEDPRGMKHFRRGIMTVRPEGDYDLSIKVFVDGEFKDTKIVELDGGGAVYGAAVYDTDVYGGEDLSEGDFDLGYIGRRIQFEVFNDVVDQEFFVSGLMLDYKPLGNRPGADTGAG